MIRFGIFLLLIANTCSAGLPKVAPCKPAKVTGGSCLQEFEDKQKICYDLVGEHGDENSGQEICKTSKGKWSSTPCAKENLSGSCDTKFNSADRAVIRYYSPYTKEQAKESCPE